MNLTPALYTLPVISYVAGIALHAHLAYFWPLLLPLLVLSLSLAYQQRQLKLALSCLVICLGGMAWAGFCRPMPSEQDPAHLAPAERISLTGTLSSDLTPKSEVAQKASHSAKPDPELKPKQRWVFEMAAESAKGQTLTGKVRILLKPIICLSLKLVTRLKSPAVWLYLRQPLTLGLFLIATISAIRVFLALFTLKISKKLRMARPGLRFDSYKVCVARFSPALKAVYL